MLEENTKIYDIFGFALREDETDYHPSVLGEEKRDEWKDIISGWEDWKNDEGNLWQVVSDGIPNCMRRKAWLLLTGAKQRMEQEPDLFERMEAAKVTIETHQLEALKMDLHRTFPDHALFESDAFGQQELERVLKAVVCHLPEVGYCQGMSFVAAVLLMFMEAEEAFYTLIVLIEKHLSRYYSPGSNDLIFDSKVLWNLVKYRCPLMTAHIERERLDALVFATPWFTSLYSCYIRSWPLFLRFFDLYCLEGEVAIYRFGISFLSLHQHTITSLWGIETLLPFLQNMGSRSSLDGKQGQNLLTIALNIKKSVLLSELTLAKSEASNPLLYPSPTSTPSASRKRPAPTTITVEDVPRTPSLGRFTEGFSSLLNSVKKQCTEMFTPTPATLFTPSTRQQLAASYHNNPSSVLRSSTRPVVMGSTQRQPYPQQPPSASTSASVTRSARQRMVHASSPTSTSRDCSVIPFSSIRQQQQQQQQPQQQPTPSMFSCSFASSPTSTVNSMTRHPSSHRRILAAVSPTPASPTTSLLKRKRPLPLHLMNQNQPPVSPVKTPTKIQTQKTVTIVASPQDKENEDEFGVVASSPPSSRRPKTPLSSRSVSRDPPTSPTRSSPSSIRLSRIASLRSKTVSPSPTSVSSSFSTSSSSTLRSPSAPSSIRRSRMISPKLRISSPSIKPKRVSSSEVENLSPGPALMKQSSSSTTPLPLHRLRTDAATLLRSPYHSHRSFC